jgi:hypothetical protein
MFIEGEINNYRLIEGGNSKYRLIEGGTSKYFTRNPFHNILTWVNIETSQILSSTKNVKYFAYRALCCKMFVSLCLDKSRESFPVYE